MSGTLRVPPAVEVILVACDVWTFREVGVLDWIVWPVIRWIGRLGEKLLALFATSVARTNKSRPDGADLPLVLEEPTPSEPDTKAYELVPALLTAAEWSFFKVLNKAASKSGVFIACKVRLPDLVSVRNGVDNPRAAWNRISSKHVDFVLCSTSGSRPLLAIELDDSSHAKKSRRERDSFVDESLAAAGLAMLRVPARKAYSVEELRASIRDFLPAS